jgi:hypothetical protein
MGEPSSQFVLGPNQLFQQFMSVLINQIVLWYMVTQHGNEMVKAFEKRIEDAKEGSSAESVGVESEKNSALRERIAS